MKTLEPISRLDSRVGATRLAPAAVTPRLAAFLPSALVWVAVAGAAVYAMREAIRWAWVCDDAFISFRYARNLARGLGLVFNAGERVEGYTNLLWTLGCALGIRLGIRPEAWSVAWGLFFFALSIALLAYHHFQMRPALRLGALAAPVAAIGAALHPDWHVHATSGLETSAFTALALAGYVLLAGSALGRTHRPVGAALVLGLAGLTRPEGMIFAAVGAGFFATVARPRRRVVLKYLATLAMIYIPLFIWRTWYYGDFLPNTYYAKSAGLAWWDQGLLYIQLYFERYAVVLVSLPLLAAIAVWPRVHPKSGGAPPASWRLCALAGAFAAAYTLYVARVGGDFMFARMLIPATPYCLILLELAVLGVPRIGDLGRLGLATAVLVAFIRFTDTAEAINMRGGIVNEREFYGQSLMREEGNAAVADMKKYFGGLPLRIAFFGAQAHLIYHLDVPMAVEAEAGLTDRFVARQELAHRGRVGHEKHAPLEYLVRTRRVPFALGFNPLSVLELERFVPVYQVDAGVISGFLLYWDAELVAELRKRGARVPDAPRDLDTLLPALERMDRPLVEDLYRKWKLFYFEHVPDPQREAAFQRRLADR